MKVIAFNGSPRKNGNTSLLIKAVFAELEKENIQTELISLTESHLKGCMACYQCYQNKDQKCIIKDDLFNDYIQKMIQADGIILGSSVYVADVTSAMKAFMDRACLVGRANQNLFRRKLGASVMAVRRGGEIHAYDTMNHFFGIMEMITIGSSYWNFGFGGQPGEVLNDEDGLKTMRVLGENMAWALKKLKS